MTAPTVGSGPPGKPTYRTKGPGRLYEQAEAFQRDVDALDRKAAQALTEAWATTYGQIRQEMDDLVGKMAAATAAGQEIKPGWLYQKDRLRNALGTTKDALAKYGTVVGVTTKGSQAAAVLAAVKHAQKQVATAHDQVLPKGVSIDFDKIDPTNLQHLVATLRPDTPLRKLLDSIPAAGVRDLEKRLVTGVALGWNPRKIAASVEQGLGLTKHRALVIARTETLRSYREATRIQYATSPVVSGWVWHSALDRRTCPACVAKHGTVHPVTERLDGHPQCRCAMVPDTVPLSSLGPEFAGMADTSPQIETGLSWFMRQSAAVQRAIVGPGKHKMISDGEIGLADVVGRRWSDDWGTMRYERSIREIREGRNADYDAPPKPITPVRTKPDTNDPAIQGQSDLPEGYYGVQIRPNHLSQPLPAPNKNMVKAHAAHTSLDDLERMAITGKDAVNGKPLTPQDYADVLAALDEVAPKTMLRAHHPAVSKTEPEDWMVEIIQTKLEDGSLDEEAIQKILATGKGATGAAISPTHYATYEKAWLNYQAKQQAKAAEAAEIESNALLTVQAIKAHHDPAYMLGTYKQIIQQTSTGGQETTGYKAIVKAVQMYEAEQGAAAAQAAQAALKAFPHDPKALTRDSSITLGGAHTKAVYTAPDGSKWLHKPQDEFRATLDAVTAAVQRKAGLPTPETYVVSVDGKVGSLQRLFDARNAFGDSPHAFDAAKLQAHDVLELQKHDVFDWMISNHDGHAQQYLRRKGADSPTGSGQGSAGNPLVGIDKGQAFRFFGKDKLDYTYEPNAGYGVTKVANILNRETAKGKPPAGWQSAADQGELRSFIQTLEAIPDDEYRALLRPYAEQARARGFLAKGSQYENDVDAFLDAAVQRKNSLLKDWSEFHKKIKAEHDKALGIQPQAAAPKAPAKPVTAGLGKVSATWPKYIKELWKAANYGDEGAYDTLVQAGYLMGKDVDGLRAKVLATGVKNRARQTSTDGLPDPSGFSLQGMTTAIEHDKGKGRYDDPAEARSWWKARDTWTAAIRARSAVYNAVKKYTGSGYDPINSDLRHLRWESGNWAGVIRRMDEAIQEATVPEDVIVHRAAGQFAMEPMFRAANTTHAFPDAAKAGGPSSGYREADMTALQGWVIEERGFASASIGHTPKYGNRGVVLKIRVPKGSKGLYVDNGLSANPGEAEIILPRGSQFYVHRAYRDDTHQSGGWVLDVEIVPKGWRPTQ